MAKGKSEGRVGGNASCILFQLSSLYAQFYPANISFVLLNKERVEGVGENRVPSFFYWKGGAKY
jgi:hypothetical protein